jgi:hypothetical protein
MKTGESNTIPVLLTKIDAERFILFQRHYDVICALVDSTALETSNGKVTLSFNHQNELMEIELQKKLFRKKKDS